VAPFDACPRRIAGCNVTVEDLDGMTFRTWNTRDFEKKTVETGKYFKKSDGQLCFKGKKSGTNCVKLLDGRLITDKVPWVSGRLLANGQIVWSHGYRQAPLSGSCSMPERRVREEPQMIEEEPFIIEEPSEPMEPVYEDNYSPNCRINWSNWAGSKSYVIKTKGDP
jgi:hypothetical protein